MPELPEIETICNGLQSISNCKINEVFCSSKKLRINSQIDLQHLKGKIITKISRRARYLVIEIGDAEEIFNSSKLKKTKEIQENFILLIHLGMSGRLTLSSEFYHEKHDHFACRISENSNKKSSDLWLIFNDPRRFGFVDLVQKNQFFKHKSISKLGIEPLSNQFSAEFLQEKLKKKSTNIKTAMMDNEVVVGVGNIYINESLFLAGISPIRAASSLKMNELKKLVFAIKKTLESAIAMGGSSISDYRNAKGDFGNFQTILKVYGKEGCSCLICQKPISRITQNGRSTFFCKFCQR